jgi:hypothetical protein
MVLVVVSKVEQRLDAGLRRSGWRVSDRGRGHDRGDRVSVPPLRRCARARLARIPAPIPSRDRAGCWTPRVVFSLA